ncbi:hypothetical protein, partial [Nocardia brevicatena]|uniref:hypothetical protein n=1 Tax=Nocardia brevicatena TaxID=37327 RepID=UPI0005930CF3
MKLADEDLYCEGVAALGEGSDSPKAWMSPEDADLLEAIFLKICLRNNRPASFLEWGSGLSTLTFTRSLAERGHTFRWITVEHDREFMTTRVDPYLSLWSQYRMLRRDDEQPLPSGMEQFWGVAALVYDGGRLTPALAGCEDHRHADLDSYVAEPTQLGVGFDAILVDGRKRRRCLLVAQTALNTGGIVLLHDAFREYYQCAWDAYPAWRRIGHEIWIGAAQGH